MVQDTYQVGGLKLGVRWSDADLAEGLRDYLCNYISDGPSPPNFSVVVGESSGTVRAKHFVYFGLTAILSTTSAQEVYDAIARYMSDAASWNTGSGLLRLRTRILVAEENPNVAMLVDERLAGYLEREMPKLRRSGFELLPEPAAHIDVENKQVVIPMPVGASSRGVPNGQPPRRLEIGKILVGVWGSVQTVDDPADRKRHAMVLARNPLDMSVMVEQAAKSLRLFEAVEPSCLRAASDTDWLAALSN